MGPDFSRWAVVSHNDDTGFGRQADDLKAVLGIKWHFVIPSERLFDKPLRSVQESILPANAPEEQVRKLVRQVEGVIFFERPDWHPELLRICREENVRSVCCPNWEWFRGSDPRWKLLDLFVCTSQFSRRIVESYSFSNIVDIGPWPLNLEAFPKREICGPCRLFIHNAGIVDPQDRKGTWDTIKAFRKVHRDDIRLIVRIQKPAELPELDSRIELKIGNLAEPAALYAEGEVAIQPSKMEGNGFMVLEPMLCGIPTITLDYPPMNEYATDPRLLVRKRWFKRRAFPTAWVPHAHLRLPSIRDLAQKIEWCAENDLAVFSANNRAWAEVVFAKSRMQETWQAALSR